MHSDDETVDVAGSEEEETDSEREPSAEATISTVAFFFNANVSFFQVPDPPMGLELPTRRCSTEPGWQNSLFPPYLANILSTFYGSV